VRVIRFTATIRGHRARRITLVTTLLDPKLYPAQELIALSFPCVGIVRQGMGLHPDI
jgi:hypothetical protein